MCKIKTNNTLNSYYQNIVAFASAFALGLILLYFGVWMKLTIALVSFVAVFVRYWLIDHPIQFLPLDKEEKKNAKDSKKN